MSTLRVAAINNPSASSGGLAISASGLVTGAGLDLIVTQSFSAASSVSLNNCFSADYDNYRIVYTGALQTGTSPIRMRLRVSSTDAAGGDYQALILVTNDATGPFRATQASQTSWDMFGMDGSNSAHSRGSIDLFSPFLAVRTSFLATSMLVYTNASFAENRYTSGYHNLTTSYSGLTIYPSGGTFSGSVSVYGLRK